MKKEKLMKLLAELPDGVDVVIWNGFVEDYNEIDSLDEDILVRQSFDGWLELVERDRRIKEKNWDFKFSAEEVAEMKKNFTRSHREWEFRNPFMSDDLMRESKYKTKKVFLITAKLRGKSTRDRLGKMSY